MNYLLDSHIVYWTLADVKKLSKQVREIVENKDDELYISQVTLMELTIKMNLGKLTYGTGVEDLIKDIETLNLKWLSLESEDFKEYAKLKLHHRDPFDRFLIAQAKSNKLTIITSDQAFKDYDISLVFN